MHRQLLVTLALAAGLASPAAWAQGADAARTAAQICASCHGLRGESISPAFPRLAGQQQAYVEAQLKAFRDRTRADPMAQAYMWGMSSQLSDDAIKGLSAYYAGQKPVPGKKGDAKLVEQGRAIYEQGVAAAGITACFTCHGKDAEGNGPIPRLAGQHAEYLVKQLGIFKAQLRTEGSAQLMHGISSAMTFEQMEAVGAYLMSR
jgi:cytochrome c553